MFKQISILLIFTMVLCNAQILVGASSTYVIKITMNFKESFMITIAYLDSSGKKQSYVNLDAGNQTYTINGDITYVSMIPSTQLFSPYSTAKMQIIRSNQVLITKTASNGNAIEWDSVKEPLPAESPLEQIPAYPTASLIVGAILVVGILYKRDQSRIKI